MEENWAGGAGAMLYDEYCMLQGVSSVHAVFLNADFMQRGFQTFNFGILSAQNQGKIASAFEGIKDVCRFQHVFY